MLTRASECLRDLVPLLPDGPPSTAPSIRKADAVTVIRQKRAAGRQELAFAARPFILCGLPIRRLPHDCLRYSRRNGRFFLDVIGHPDYGLPFGQDRLIPLWIATQAVRRQSRTIEFESASQILSELGLPLNGAHYRRLADGFRRIFGSTIFFGNHDAKPKAEVWDCGRLHFFERMRLWFRAEEGTSDSKQMWFGRSQTTPVVWTSTPGWLGGAFRLDRRNRCRCLGPSA